MWRKSWTSRPSFSKSLANCAGRLISPLITWKLRTLVVAAPRELEHEVIGVQRVEERDQIAPEPAQRRLSTVVAKADVDRLLVDDAVEHVIDGLNRPRRVLRVLGDARLVQLHRIRLDQFELAPQHAGDVHRQIR